MSKAIEILASQTVTKNGGILHRVKHRSNATKTDMIFAIFLPKSYAKESNRNHPVIYWLSGLTCNDTNFCQKAGPVAFAKAEEENIVIVAPDTSPRGDDVPDDDAYDLGQGAGFYIDATRAPWSEHFRTETYVTQELVELVEAEWGVGRNGLKSIMGHSMGGHGALTLALKAPKGTWAAVSAFSPICHPTACPWGRKAFENYFGSNDAGKDHDATILIQKPGNVEKFENIVIEVGLADNFLQDGQLLIDDFESACKKVGQTVSVNRHEGHDHSFYFIASFIADHVAHHAKQFRPLAT